MEDNVIGGDFTIVVLGGSGVGKTPIIYKAMGMESPLDRFLPEMDDVLEIGISLDGVPVSLAVIDAHSASAERFLSSSMGSSSASLSSPSISPASSPNSSVVKHLSEPSVPSSLTIFPTEEPSSTLATSSPFPPNASSSSSLKLHSSPFPPSATSSSSLESPNSNQYTSIVYTSPRSSLFTPPGSRNTPFKLPPGARDKNPNSTPTTTSLSAPSSPRGTPPDNTSPQSTSTNTSPRSTSNNTSPKASNDNLSEKERAKKEKKERKDREKAEKAREKMKAREKSLSKILKPVPHPEPKLENNEIVANPAGTVSLSLPAFVGIEDKGSSLEQLLTKGEGFLVVFSLCDMNSVEFTSSLLRCLNEKDLIKGKGLVLIGNKLDLISRGRGGAPKDEGVVQEVDEEVGRKMAEDFGCGAYVEVSAKTGEGIARAFQEVVKDIIRRRSVNLIDHLTTKRTEAKARQRGSCVVV